MTFHDSASGNGLVEHGEAKSESALKPTGRDGPQRDLRLGATRAGATPPRPTHAHFVLGIAWRFAQSPAPKQDYRAQQLEAGNMQISVYKKKKKKRFFFYNFLKNSTTVNGKFFSAKIVKKKS